MRAVLQRVNRASVLLEDGQRREIGPGLAILLGVREGDSDREARFLAQKSANLRIFTDEEDKMNRSLLDELGEALVVSNFTLYADCKKGKRPSFSPAGKPPFSEELYRVFVSALSECGVKTVKTGEFGADMLVTIENDGPVAVILDTDEIMPRKS